MYIEIVLWAAGRLSYPHGYQYLSVSLVWDSLHLFLYDVHASGFGLCPFRLECLVVRLSS